MLAVVGRSWLSWIEQQATNLWVGSSNLSGRTTQIIGRLATTGRPFSFPVKKPKKCLTFPGRTTNVHFHQALVAQLDRATGYEPVGREFESLRAHHSRAKAYEDNLISLFSYPFQSIPQNKGSAAEDSCRCIPIEAVSLPPHTYLLPPLRKRRHPILVNALRPGGHRVHRRPGLTPPATHPFH